MCIRVYTDTHKQSCIYAKRKHWHKYFLTPISRMDITKRYDFFSKFFIVCSKIFYNECVFLLLSKFSTPILYGQDELTSSHGHTKITTTLENNMRTSRKDQLLEI